MKYLIRVRAYESHTIWYGVEADSADEAEKLYYQGEAEEISDQYEETLDSEINLIEPDTDGIL